MTPFGKPKPDPYPPESNRPLNRDGRIWLVTRRVIRESVTLWVADTPEQAEEGNGHYLAALKEGSRVEFDTTRELREAVS